MTQEEIEKKAYEAYPEPRGKDYLSEWAYNTAALDASLRRKGYIKALTEMDIVEGMKSPFTGGKVKIEGEERVINYRGEKITVMDKHYRCLDTGEIFTDAKLDDDLLWNAFRAYWDKKGAEHFYDIDGYGSPTIEGWVKRDEGGQLTLNIPNPPAGDEFMLIPSNTFPDVSPSDGEVKVKITIQKV